jgi:type I restriction enzyme R subunit
MPMSNDGSTDIPTESGVERSLLAWLRDLPGPHHWTVYGLGEGEGAAVLDREYERENRQVVYWNLLRERLIAINDDINERNADRLITSLRRDLDHDELMAGNRHVHQLLRRGKKFNAKHGNGTTKPVYVDLIDFEHPENNAFVAVNQMRVTRGPSVRPDVTLLVNGLPLVHMELKSLTQDNDYTDAIADLSDYEEKVPRLFYPTLLNIAADTQALRYGAVGARPGFYFPWSRAPLQYQDGNELKQAVQALLNPATLLDMLRNYVFYEQKEGGTAKIVPRHMQYYAVREILGRIREGQKRRGLIWHTQGSGKSYTMLYAAKNLLEREVMGSPQLFLVVDTDKLATQMGNTLSAIDFDRSVVAGSMEHLERLIEQGQSQLVLTTIQKFQDVAAGRQGNPEVVVMADEAHRFMERLLGNKLEGAMPDAWHFGFTGTPVHEGESEVARSTFRNYCPGGEPPLHRYSIRDGIQDEVILPVYFTLRHQAEWAMDEEAMDEAFDLSLQHLPKDQKLATIRKALTPRDLGELRPRLETYADVVVDHFAGIEQNGWKGMVVAPSRKSAALYGQMLAERRSAGDVAVLYTAAEKDSDLIAQFHTSREERDAIIRRFKEEKQPKLLVVHNMLLTGFDAPILKTMYLDRRLTDHNLLQAIARTNRPAKAKTNGEIVDFQGVFENLDEALSYDAETRSFAAKDKDQLFAEFEAQLDSIYGLFDEVAKTDSQEALHQALARVSKHPARRDFKQGYQRLQDLYESVSPDQRLADPTIEKKYRWLSHVWVAFRRANNRDEHPEETIREKTREIVEQHVDVTRVKEDFPIYKVGQDHLEAIRGQEPAAQASSIAHAVQAHLRPRVGQNPAYEKLSERVQEVLHRWQSNQISDPDAVDALERLERQIIEMQNTAEEHGFDEIEHAIFVLLTGDYDVPADRAEGLANIVTERVDREVDTNYAGWQRNETALKQIQQEVMRALISETETELVKQGFAQDALQYIVANHA